MTRDEALARFAVIASASHPNLHVSDQDREALRMMLDEVIHGEAVLINQWANEAERRARLTRGIEFDSHDDDYHRGHCYGEAKAYELIASDMRASLNKDQP